MRIESLDLEQPAVRIAVAFKEFETVGEALDRREILLFLYELAIDDVLGEVLAPRFGELPLMVLFPQPFPMRLHHGLPWIALLSADKLVGVVAVVIGRAAVFPIVKVVRDQVAVDARLVEELGKGSCRMAPSGPQLRCRKLSRPVCMSRRAGMQGRATDIVLVESGRPFGKAVEVRCRDARAAIGPQACAGSGNRTERIRPSWKILSIDTELAADVYLTAPGGQALDDVALADQQQHECGEDQKARHSRPSACTGSRNPARTWRLLLVP